MWEGGGGGAFLESQIMMVAITVKVVIYSGGNVHIFWIKQYVLVLNMLMHDLAHAIFYFFNMCGDVLRIFRFTA